MTIFLWHCHNSPIQMYFYISLPGQGKILKINNIKCQVTGQSTNTVTSWLPCGNLTVVGNPYNCLEVSLLLLQSFYLMAAVCYHHTVIKCTFLCMKPFLFHYIITVLLNLTLIIYKVSVYFMNLN